MSRHEKLVERFLSKPRNFTWEELKMLLNGFGYDEAPKGKTSGSRRRFVHPTRGPISLHTPHPGNELKSYQVAQIITFLKAEGLL